MGWLRSGVTFPVGCLVLVWTAGAGGVEILGEPTCISDYLNTSTCQWQMNRPTNCSAELHLNYRLDSFFSQEPENNFTCVPENRGIAECVCILQMETLVVADTYKLSLWAGSRLLWNISFIPYQHVKPRTPSDLLIRANISDTWLLTWSNPYPPSHSLYSELTYLVSITNEDDPADFKLYNVTYKDTALLFAASTLRSRASYSARVRALASDYSSMWSDWSAPVSWRNYYPPPFEQRLQLGVSVSCTVILFIFVSCYFSIAKIKKEWWDQIPSPARSPLMAIVIQEPQVPMWGKPRPSKEASRCPRWKTCLTKLLPCFLEHDQEHDQERDEVATKAPGNGPAQGPGVSAWCPLEVSKTVLWPERISVVQCVELAQAPAACKEEEEQEEEEQEREGIGPSPGSSSEAFLEGRKDIADRLTERLFLGLFGADPGLCSPEDVGVSGLMAPAESEMHWVGLPGVGPQAASCQGEGQPFCSGSTPMAPLPPSPACPASLTRPATVTDNPAYRSFQQCLEVGSSHPAGGHPGDGDPSVPGGPPPSCLQQPEPETQQQSLLQHPAVTPALAPLPASGYRDFVQAVEQGAAGDSAVAGCAEQAGYKAFSSLLTCGASCPGSPGTRDGSSSSSSSSGAYKPFESLAPGAPAAPVPLFTFGLDPEPPHGSPEPGKGGPLPEQDTEPLKEELGSAIVYSALTCHLCGHLKQCHGQEDRVKTPVVASSPCCGCCCADELPPPGSPLKTPAPLPRGLLLEPSLSSALLTSWTISEEGGVSKPPAAPTCLSTS